MKKTHQCEFLVSHGISRCQKRLRFKSDYNSLLEFIDQQKYFMDKIEENLKHPSFPQDIQYIKREKTSIENYKERIKLFKSYYSFLKDCFICDNHLPIYKLQVFKINFNKIKKNRLRKYKDELDQYLIPDLNNIVLSYLDIKESNK